MVLSFEGEECNHVADDDAKWVINLEASYHAKPIKEFFTFGDFGIVKIGNSSHSKIDGISDICIETSVGCTLTLKDIRNVPDLRLNLISTSTLDRLGYGNFFGGGKWKLTKGSLVVARGDTCVSLYKMRAKVSNSGLNTVEENSSPNL